MLDKSMTWDEIVDGYFFHIIYVGQLKSVIGK